MCKLQGETTWSPLAHESGGPSCLVIPPALSVLSRLNRISSQLTKSHASEGSLISPASQTFYFIPLSSKGHCFFSFYCSTKHTIFFSAMKSAYQKREKKEKAHCFKAISGAAWRRFLVELMSRVASETDVRAPQDVFQGRGVHMMSFDSQPELLVHFGTFGIMHLDKDFY